MAEKMIPMRAPDGHVFLTSNGDWHKDAVKISKREYAAGAEKQARALLLEHLKPGSVVYTKVNRVYASGMSRSISLYVITKPKVEGESPVNWNISGYVAELTGHRRDKRELAIIVNGCGMDMAWNTVYVLGQALWPQGTPEPHGTRNGEPDSTGGYALNQRSL
jgi:hypothetical protein